MNEDEDLPPPSYEDAISDPNIVSLDSQNIPKAASSNTGPAGPSIPSAPPPPPPETNCHDSPSYPLPSQPTDWIQPPPDESNSSPDLESPEIHPNGLTSHQEDIPSGANPGNVLSEHDEFKLIMKVYNILIAQFLLAALAVSNSYFIILDHPVDQPYLSQDRIDNPPINAGMVALSITAWLFGISILALGSEMRRRSRCLAILGLLSFIGLEIWALFCISANNSFGIQDDGQSMLGSGFTFKLPAPFWFLFILFLNTSVHRKFRIPFASCSLKSVLLHILALVVCSAITYVMGQAMVGLVTGIIAYLASFYLNCMTLAALKGFRQSKLVPGPKDSVYVALNIQIGLPIILANRLRVAWNC